MLWRGPAQVCGRIPETAGSMLLRVLGTRRDPDGGRLRMDEELPWRQCSGLGLWYSQEIDWVDLTSPEFRVPCLSLTSNHRRFSEFCQQLGKVTENKPSSPGLL